MWETQFEAMTKDLMKPMVPVATLAQEKQSFEQLVLDEDLFLFKGSPGTSFTARRP